MLKAACGVTCVTVAAIVARPGPCGRTAGRRESAGLPTVSGKVYACVCRLGGGGLVSHLFQVETSFKFTVVMLE